VTEVLYRVWRKEEAALIDKKAELLRCGRELFSTKGFKDTNVVDITKAAGMAAGTFYIYFPSKDKLFMDIFIEENIKLKKSILDELDLEAEPAAVIGEIMEKNIRGLNSNPILKQWYNKDVFGRIEKLYREENGTDYISFMYDCFIDIVRKWQCDGKMRSDIDAEMIMAIFAALINIDTHKDEIGLQYFPQIMEIMGNFVMKGLTDTSS
jgi:AcrR family transcriptional regulator